MSGDGKNRWKSDDVDSRFSVMTTQHRWLVLSKWGKTSQRQVTWFDLRLRYKKVGHCQEKILLPWELLSLRGRWVYLFGWTEHRGAKADEKMVSPGIRSGQTAKQTWREVTACTNRGSVNVPSWTKLLESHETIHLTSLSCVTKQRNGIYPFKWVETKHSDKRQEFI